MWNKSVFLCHHGKYHHCYTGNRKMSEEQSCSCIIIVKFVNRFISRFLSCYQSSNDFVIIIKFTESNINI